MNNVVHSFQASLARSHEHADAPWWDGVYRTAFPSMAACVCIRDDGWAQRGGVDRVITLKSGRTILVDEKVREKTWPDILLERWSDDRKKTPGWVQKQLLCEFIAYAFIPSETCYLLPTLTLQRAWRIHGRDWIAEYGEVRSPNPGYFTASVPVPIDVLMGALNEATVIQWGAAA